MSTEDFDSQVTSIAMLVEPVRRALYLYVVDQGAPVGREQAAAVVGVAHHVAKVNLDRLEKEGLLEVEILPPTRAVRTRSRPPGEAMPAHPREIEVSLPERYYDLAGPVMATAIAASEQTLTPIREALVVAATDAGQALAQEVRAKARRPAKPGNNLHGRH